ncbi:hypothetical protein M404DRAFT_998081 [Pisolithus tinctorius Marx 270]|uniref:Uncharacterized protein n=1 Tax=Pisolithus tinctorius Marx 270 TaxID=870435 RepID=A0A0C3PG82_PISTI|nr:hypothetical protein M404DRAFT_998081 [Pisolithus tinctorius Marx 270]
METDDASGKQLRDTAVDNSFALEQALSLVNKYFTKRKRSLTTSHLQTEVSIRCSSPRVVLQMCQGIQQFSGLGS